MPVYSCSSVRYDTQEVITILLDPDLNTDTIYKAQPTDIAHITSLVVVLSKLRCTKDLYSDDMGSWHYNGIYKSWIEVDFTGYTLPYLANQNLYWQMKIFII